MFLTTVCEIVFTGSVYFSVDANAYPRCLVSRYLHICLVDILHFSLTDTEFLVVRHYKVYGLEGPLILWS